MNILVIGATGRTGRHVLQQGEARGHAMTAFTRRPDALAGLEPSRVVHGDGLEHDSVRHAVEGHDAVIAIISPEHLGPSTTTSDVTRNVVRAMEATGVRRLILTSSRSITATRPRVPLFLVWAWLRHAYVDLVRAETIVQESALDWTLARATMLTDGSPKGRVHIDFEANATGGESRLDRADFALALLDAAEDPALVRRAIGICGAKGKALPREAA